ncbi:DNA-binding protein [Clostridium bornimense]|uniref:DNA-binding protein n=1 Tax=Clostridium bornimense TaxID=1216932 RepID=W6S1E6_9CLOT|nr:XRE family transcriptional regulator [Clostridium bornimense]CDM69699.1 DNA-binding protein [Clostridium bornimense]
MSRIGEKIKNLRNKKGLTQKQLSKKLGVSESFINDIELGRKIINESLMSKLTKVLGEDLNDLTLSNDTPSEPINKVNTSEFMSQKNKQSKETPINSIWTDALSSVVKSVPVYNYELKTLSTIPRVVNNNKIENFNSDKVFYLIIEDTDLSEYRIEKGDKGFLVKIGELENNSLCFIEYKNQRSIKYIKNLGNGKYLLLSKGGKFSETVDKKNIKPLGKLINIEFNFKD